MGLRIGTTAVARNDSGSVRFDGNILGEGFEAFAVGLNHRDRHMAGLAGVEVRHGAGFAGVGATDDFALSAGFQFGRWFGFHSLRGVQAVPESESVGSLGMQIQRTR